MAKSLPAKKETGGNPAFVFGKINYILMVAGIAVIALGYVLMIGGGPQDPSVFNSAELYSTTRIKLSPVIILAGMLIELFAILVKAKD